MTDPRVVVVGLGPAGVDLLLPAARAAMSSAVAVLVRTERHPVVRDLRREGLPIEALDRHYEEAADLDAAYAAIVEHVLAAARTVGEVVYAVPGAPTVAERTVRLLLEAARSEGIEVEVVPGLSFVDLAWARLGVDPMGGARVLDARTVEPADLLLGGPVLFAQCDAPAVLSDLKLALLEVLAADHPVTVVQRLGSPDEAVVDVAVEDLDREITPDHLTSVHVDLGAGPADEFARFVALIERLRAPGGCPWDAEQTHHSLTRHLIEEAYEVVEAIEMLPADAPGGAEPVEPAAYALLEEELGDLAAQVVFHATLARETGAFTMTEVLAGISEKLVRRHPHVFGDTDVSGAEDVARNWEQIKRDEKGGDDAEASLMQDVPAALPSLLYTHKLFRKAEAGGLALMRPGEAAAAIADAVARMGAATDAEAERLAGEVLAAVVVMARAKGFDAESALRGWAHRFRDRFQHLERLARERGVRLEEADPAAVAALWIEASPGASRA